MQKIPELVCPAGNLPALKTAVDNGADTVYMGLKDATNARNFPGLNFDMKSAREGVAYDPCARAQCTDGHQYICTSGPSGALARRCGSRRRIWVPMRLLLPTPPSWRMRQTNIRIYACICRYKVRPPITKPSI